MRSPTLIYAGVGSRSTPPDVLELFRSLATTLARHGWVLRTGGSPGADQSFYRGACAGRGTVELYLPWPDFETDGWDAADEHVRVFPRPSDDAYALAAEFHPHWNDLSPEERNLIARDGHQVLGANLDSPVGLVVCWTPDGGIDGCSARSEGTGQALRIAEHHRLPVLNLACPDHAAHTETPGHTGRSVDLPPCERTAPRSAR